MPAPNPKVVALEKQLDAQTKNIAALQVELDRAADEGDKPLIVQIQSELAASETLLKSTERRLAAALKQETKEAKDVRKAENMSALKLVQDGLARQQQIAPRVIKAVQKLAEELEAMHSAGRASRAAMSSLIRQLPHSQRVEAWDLLHRVEGAHALGVFVAGLLQKSAVFGELAPNENVRLGRHDYDAQEFFAHRAEQLSGAVAILAERVNAEI